MSAIKRMASNTFYIFLNSLSFTILSLIYFVIAGKLLTPSEYGIANSIIQFTTLIASFSMLGLTNAILKLVSEYYATKKMKKLYGAVKYSFKILLLVNLMVAAIIFFISPALAAYIFKNPNLTSTFEISSLIILVFSLASYFGSVVYGLGKVKVYFLTDFLANFVKVVLAIPLIIFFKFGFWGPILGYLLGLVFSAFIRFTEIKLKDKGRPDTTTIWYYAFPALISTIGGAILTATPVLILSAFSSTTEAGIFTLVNALASLLIFVPNILYTASFPIFSGMYGKKDHKGIEELLNMVFRYTILISVPLSLIFVLFPSFLIRIVAKPAYLVGSNALSILGIVGLLYGIGNILLNALYAIGKPKLSRNIMIGTLIIYLILSIPLSMLYGSVGMAITYLLAFLFLFSLSLFFTLKFYCLNINRNYIPKVLFSSLIWLLVLIVATFLSDSIYVFMVTSLIGFFLYVFLLLVLKAFSVNDLKMLREFRKIFPKSFSFIFAFLEELISRFL
jgi:O-antigen/teichoic acid export membrane protein